MLPDMKSNPAFVSFVPNTNTRTIMVNKNNE